MSAWIDRRGSAEARPAASSARSVACSGPGRGSTTSSSRATLPSRKTPWAEIVVHQPWYREQLGKAYTRLVRRVIADVSDVTCGFKAFRAAAAKDIFARVRLYDWSFDAEVLLLVRQLAYRLDEVAVRWEDRAGSRVRLVRDVARSLWGIVRIRANALRGVYRTSTLDLPDGDAWEWTPRPSVARAPAR